MQELPDANAAEAIGRLPGISLKRNSGEADKVVIRGLSAKYSNVTIEGIKMASTSDYDRSVDLSLVQSEMLVRSRNIKIIAPRYGCRCTGRNDQSEIDGSSESRRMIEFGLEGGYANLNQSFGNYKADVGYSDRFFDKKLGVTLRASKERKDMPSQRFNGTYSALHIGHKTSDEGVVVDSLFYVDTENGLVLLTSANTYADQRQSDPGLP